MKSKILQYVCSTQCPDLIPLVLCADTATDIKVVMPFSIGHCKLFNGPGDHRAQMLQEWVGLAITDDAFMAAGILLSTCRYILARHPNRLVFTTMLLQYKSTCIEALRHEVSDNLSQIKVTTVAKALALAIDEVRLLSLLFSVD